MIKFTPLNMSLDTAIKQHANTKCVVFACKDSFMLYFFRIIEHDVFTIYKPKGTMRWGDINVWLNVCSEDPYEERYYGMFLEHTQIITFFNKYKNRLSVHEKEILDYLIENKIIVKNGKYYRSMMNFGFIINNLSTDRIHKTVDGSESIVRHEYSHFLFRYEPKYKRAVNRLYKSTTAEYKQNLKKRFKIKQLGFSIEEWACYRIAQAKFKSYDKYLTKACKKEMNNLIKIFNSYYN